MPNVYATIRRELEKRIFSQATPVQAKSLHEDRNYGAPYSFWRAALDYGLINQMEFETARRSYGDLWHYRGD